jgi:uncharacterized membrane protein YczE
MTGLAARGVGSVRLVRTALELAALTLGWLLGGRVGIGTLAFALTIGPNVQFFLQRLTYRAAQPPPSQSQPIPQPDPDPAPIAA